MRTIERCIEMAGGSNRDDYHVNIKATEDLYTEIAKLRRDSAIKSELLAELEHMIFVMDAVHTIWAKQNKLEDLWPASYDRQKVFDLIIKAGGSVRPKSI